MTDSNEIIGVAIKHNDLVACLPKPNRHHHVITYMVDTLGIDPPVGHQGKDGQGFYLSNGEYLNRYDARTLAIETGQCETPDHARELFSEDLW